MKSAIIRELEEMEIRVGDEITQADEMNIKRAVAGDTPEKIEKFYKVWYQLTSDGPGAPRYPNVKRIK